jgi:hypothetical protein
MPEEIEAALGRVAAALPPMEWATPEQIRAGAVARRQRHVVVATLAAVLVVAGGAGVARAVQPRVSPGAGAATQGPSCPMGSGIPAFVALPDYEDIKVNVYNGTPVEDLAASIADQLRHRGLQVERVGNTPDGSLLDGAVVIRYGPGAVGAAWVMQAFFAYASLEFDLDRRDDTVDVVLSQTFQELATPIEVNRKIASHGPAQLPPGTCQAD